MSSKGTMLVIAGLGLVAVSAIVAGGRSETPSAGMPESGDVAAVPAGQDTPPPDQLPRYNEAGELVRPDDWQAWVMVGASIGLSYAEDGGFEPVSSA